MATATELREKYHAKDAHIAKAFELAGENKDFSKKEVLEHLGVKSSTEAVEKISTLNTELHELWKETKSAHDLEVVEERRKMMAAELGRPANLPGIHPSGSGDGEPPRRQTKSLGQQFVESDAYKAFRESQGGIQEFTVPIEDADVKTLFQRPLGWGPDSRPIDRFVEAPTRPIQVLDLIPMDTTDQASVVYWEETVRTHAAAERYEGAAVAESTFRVEQKIAQVRFIGDSLPVTEEQLEDVGPARRYIDGRLTFACRQRADGQVLVGDGVAENIRGIINTVGIQTQAKGTDPVFDAVHKALTKVRVTGRAFPDAVVMHPNDWQDVRLTRTADGIYILGNPSEPGPMTLWGVPVALSDALTENTGLVGDFMNQSQLYQKRGVQISVGVVADQFKEFKKTIRADMRVAFVVLRPSGFCTITGI